MTKHKNEVFFKESYLMGHRAKYYAICIEFQERGRPHVHLFIWILNTPNIKNEAVYTEFIEKTNAPLPDHLKDPQLSELVTTF